MNTLENKIAMMREPLAKSVTFSASRFHVELTDGRTISIPYTWYPRLIGASKAQLEKYRIGATGAGLHWDELDEDISVEGLLAGAADGTNFARRYWQAHPEHRPQDLEKISFDEQTA
jgi:hypothetical protein